MFLPVMWYNCHNKCTIIFFLTDNLERTAFALLPPRRVQLLDTIKRTIDYINMILMR